GLGASGFRRRQASGFGVRASATHRLPLGGGGTNLEPMRPSGWILLTQISICCALGASAALYVHYLSPLDSGYCGPSSGCEAARRSGLGYFGSRYVSLPL